MVPDAAGADRVVVSPSTWLTGECGEPLLVQGVGDADIAVAWSMVEQAATIRGRAQPCCTGWVWCAIEQFQGVGCGEIVKGVHGGGDVVAQGGAQPHEMTLPFSQIKVCWTRASILIASTRALAPATGRSWGRPCGPCRPTRERRRCRSLRQPWHSRKRATCRGLTANTRYPAATRAVAQRPRAVSMSTRTCSGAEAPAVCSPIKACSSAMPATPSGCRAVAGFLSVTSWASTPW
jgi:hypothetical protein